MVSIRGLVVAMMVLVFATAKVPADMTAETRNALESVEAFGLAQMNLYRAAGPRVPASYRDVPGMEDISYTYDAAILLKHLLARGRILEARDIGDALVALQKADPAGGGQWRAAYYASSLYAPDGHTAAIRDPDSGTGNICHAADALLRLYIATGYDPYIQAAVRAAEWVDGQTRKKDAMGGFAVGLLGWTQQSQSYRVLEHQAAVSLLSKSLFQITGEARWSDMHNHAWGLINRLYEPSQGHYWTGTAGADGTVISYWPIPADQVLVSLLDDESQQRRDDVLTWVASNLAVTDEIGGRTYCGIRFSSAGQGLHVEASGFVLATRLLAGESPDDLPELASLEEIRLYAPNHDPEGIGLVAAANPSGATTGYGVTYPNSRHLGATVAYGDALLVAAGDSYGNPFHSIPEPCTIGLLLAGLPLLLMRNHRHGLRPPHCAESHDQV